MARPREQQPTAGELEVLQVLWDRGPSTVREVLEVLNDRRPRAYTTVMSLMNVMTDKGQLQRRAEGRAFVYEAVEVREKTLGGMVKALLGKAFEGSASSLVIHLLDQAHPDAEELEAIREAIEHYRNQGGS